VRIVLGGLTIADSASALRVLETSSPPTIYLPRRDFASDALHDASAARTLCEWKGLASYLDVRGGDGRLERAAAWTYPSPVAAYAALRDHVAVYPRRMDACYLDDEQVEAQEGDFYGGWITRDIQGPFKGGPGTLDW
jgi:uncharacterized protein (DUF427 family)